MQDDKLPFECSVVTVPMDQFNETKNDEKFFFIDLIRIRGRDGSPNILTNPGGPGVSGCDDLRESGYVLKELIGEDFHLVSFNPRGVGFATLAVDVNLVESENTCRLSKQKRSEGVRQSSDHFSSFAKAYSKDWAKAVSIEDYAAFVNTPQTAADMNRILERLGQQKMLYWGWSYGTSLGQTYASLYPHKVQRMIIDGVSDNFQQYSNVTEIDHLADADRVFDAFLQKCIEADFGCALYKVAQTKEALRAQLHALGESFDRHPKTIYDPSIGGCAVFDYVSFWGTVFYGLYGSWYLLAQNIASAMTGNLTGIYSLAGLQPQSTLREDCRGPMWSMCSPSDESLFLITANDALTGPDHWPQEKEALVQRLLGDLGISTFAQLNMQTSFIKQQWKIRRTHNFSQPTKVATDHPLLVLSTSYDPVCPLKMAKTANAVFEGSRLVEVEGYGHTTLSLPSKCVLDAVRSYFSNGTLPENNIKCQVSPAHSYFPELDNNGVPKRITAFGDSEDERVHLAQLELAEKFFKSSQKARIW